MTEGVPASRQATFSTLSTRPCGAFLPDAGVPGYNSPVTLSHKALKHEKVR